MWSPESRHLFIYCWNKKSQINPNSTPNSPYLLSAVNCHALNSSSSNSFLHQEICQYHCQDSTLREKKIGSTGDGMEERETKINIQWVIITGEYIYIHTYICVCIYIYTSKPILAKFHFGKKSLSKHIILIILLLPRDYESVY